MISRAKAYQLRCMIEKASVSLSDDDAYGVPELFPEWKADTQYKTDDRIRYEGILYKVLQDHTSQSDWTPDIAVSLYVAVPEPGTIPVWKQPTGSTDAYMKGDKVHFPTESDPVYISIVDNNVWSPDVYGWELS